MTGEKKKISPRDKRITAAAAIYGCKVSELMSYGISDVGRVSIIAPTGQKFIYSAEQIAEAMKPKPKPKAKPKGSARKK